MSEPEVKIKEENERIPAAFELTKYVDDDVKDEQAPKNFGGPLPTFKWLCENLFDKLDKTINHTNYYSAGGATVTDQKQRIVEHFFREWRSTVGPNIYPALCLILPHKDRTRIYNIKDQVLGRRILEILKIPKNSETTSKIMNWKRSRSAKAARMSDICIEVIQARRTDKKGGELSIGDVNDILDEMSKDEFKKEQQNKMLIELLDKMCFLELRYFFDILLKKNVVKNMENRILNTWHPDAQQYLSVVTSLKTVAYKLYDPNERLNKTDLSINLSKPFAPQLALKPNLSYSRVVQKLENDFFIEEKMDGERIQMHYDNYGKTINYWSRRATDYTYLYGQDLENGCISPHLKFVDAVQSCVLDGEMITYDPQRNAILPFGVLKGSALHELQRLESGDENKLYARPLFMVFDLLYLNGRSLANKALEERKKFLRKILNESPQFVEIIEAKRASTEDDIKLALTNAVEKGSEGVVLKQIKSHYQIDKRTDQWVKIKPEYLEEFGENVDLVVIGREKSKKDMFFCGLRVSDDDLDDDLKCKFWSFCRVANGFDKNEYREIERITQGKWKDINKEKPPASLIEFGKRVPPEWIDPKDSFVIEVKARSIDRSISKNYKTSTTLYNAYNRKIRDDKDWRTASTLDDYKHIKDSRTSVKSTEQKLVSKKKRLIRKRHRESQDEEIWNDDDFNKMSKSSEIFEGLTFMVLSDVFYKNNRITLDELSSIIHVNGGKVTKNETTIQDWSSLRIISDKFTIQASALKKKGFDILKSSWLFKCVEIKQNIQVEPKYCFKVNGELELKSNKRVDSFGDSYKIPITEDELKKLFLELNENDFNDVDIDEQLNEVLLFNDLKIYLVNIEESKHQFIHTQLLLRLQLFGAELVEDLKDSQLIIFPNYPEYELMNLKVKEIRRQLSEGLKFSDKSVTTIRLVNQDWVNASINQNIQVDAKDFPVISERS
ncbi:DNA ligase IV [Wickerhamomyces ciferrii]|uniref:DNA ligase n=1 Tax=Wickerhamomyces ciferrii (strain ATCC 14091 / BCRC 22168 / CBS 111 / JCM 3599 / NBRC 0793 / NRRL Y-1031 F-60-10) TaxID=1206466 RepID=K0KMT5_WICCF|nr:DNA ligase IV [Wickerhamomyces ciferrii]CCH43527.1 DNA ligase IV [Wickerhamomyces ciferrii]